MHALPDSINCDSTDIEFFSQLEVNTRIYYEPDVHFIASDVVPFEVAKQVQVPVYGGIRETRKLR